MERRNCCNIKVERSLKLDMSNRKEKRHKGKQRKKKDIVDSESTILVTDLIRRGGVGMESIKKRVLTKNESSGWTRKRFERKWLK